MTQWEALVLTLACEIPVVLLLARQQPVWKVLPVAAAASLITHPVAWHVASVLSPAEYRVGVWGIEGAVVLAEALWYRAWLSGVFLRALGWSLAANSVSFATGWVLFS